MVGPLLPSELGRGEHPEGGVGTVVVVLVAPVGDEDLGLQESVELFDGQQLVAHAGAVGLDPRVLPGGAGIDVAGAGTPEGAPVAQGAGGELGSVVATDEARVPAAATDDLVEGGHGGVGVDGVAGEVAQRLPGELVDHVQDLDDPPGGGDIELVVQRPHVIGSLGVEPVGRCRGLTGASALASSLGHSQTFLPPQTLDLLAVQRVALADEHGVGPPVAPPGMTSSELAQPRSQLPVGVRFDRLTALGGPVLADDLAGPPLRQPEPGLEHVHGSASPRRAHQFPLATSRKARFSSSLSATIRFSRAFSTSSSLSRLTSSAFIPPNWFRHR